MTSMSPNLKSGLFPSETPLEKTNFLFTSGYQLEVPSELGIGTCVHFSSAKALLT